MNFLNGFVSSMMAIMTDDDSPLAKQMETLDDACKSLRKEKDGAKGAAQAREAGPHSHSITTSVPGFTLE